MMIMTQGIGEVVIDASSTIIITFTDVDQSDEEKNLHHQSKVKSHLFENLVEPNGKHY